MKHNRHCLRSKALNSAKMVCAVLAAAGLFGCQGFPTTGDRGIVARDILEIKHTLKQMDDKGDSNKRSMELRMDVIGDKVQTQGEASALKMGEIDRTMRQQSDEIRTLRQELESLTYQIESLTTRFRMNTSSTAPLGPVGNALAHAPDNTGTGKPGEQAFLEAKKQFDLGRYDIAAQGFAQALDQGPDADMSLEALYYLAESDYKQNKLQDAYQNYRKLIVQDSSNPLAWSSFERLAEIMKKRGYDEEALKYYEGIAKEYPEYERIDQVRAEIQALRKTLGLPAEPDAPPSGQPESSLPPDTNNPPAAENQPPSEPN